MVAALDQWHAQGEDRRQRMLELRNRFEQRLAEKAPDAVVIGRDATRLSQTTLVAFPGLNRQALFMAADLVGVAISIGSACASGSSEPSAALAAMGLDASLREGAVRISFGFQTRADELDFAADELAKIAQNLREKSGLSGAPRPSRRT
jgi:cysteine desulfurase